MRSIKELAEAVDPARKRIEGLVRRVVTSIAGAKAIWQFTGVRQLDGSTETFSAEVFSGVGIFARPPSDVAAEAIVVMVGDGKVPIAIAVRDEKTRQAMAGNFAPDETGLYNSQAIVHITSSGGIEARSKLGVALPLPTLADANALKAAIAAAPTTDVSSFKAAILASLASWPVGTTKLKGE